LDACRYPLLFYLGAIFALLRYQLIAKATYLPEGYLRLRLRFAKPRFSLPDTIGFANPATLNQPAFASAWDGGGHALQRLR
jgi:hypothetical protein